MDSPLTISEEEISPGLVVVAAFGEIDLATSPALSERLRERGAAGDELVVLDLRGVAFLDSSGLGVLVSTLRGYLKIGVRLRLVFDQPGLQRLFAITGLDEVFAIFDSLESALEPAAGA